MGQMLDITQRIKTALVVVPYTSLDDLKQYRDAVRATGMNVNDCALVAIVKDKKERENLSSHHSLAVFASEGDFNLLGRLKNEGLSKIITRKYDLVLFVDDPPKKIRKLLVKTTRMLRVGVNNTNEDNHVNLTTSKNNPSQIFNFVFEMLKKII